MVWVHNASPELSNQSEWPRIVAVCVCLTTLMSITVGLRLYVRARMIKSVGVDDYVMLFSMVCQFSVVVSRGTDFAKGLQYHLQWTVH